MKKLVLSLSLFGLLFVGCSQEDKTKATNAAQMQMPAISVKAFEVQLEDTSFSKSYAALLKPFQEVAVVARVNGVLLKENFVEGAHVKKGDILYELQKNEYKAALDLASASVAKAEANLFKVNKNFKRAEYLYKNNAISEQQYDELLFEYNNAKAELQLSKASHSKAKIEYDYTTIKAPISGKIGISKSDVGSLVSSSNATLTTITALNPLYTEFSLPNSDVIKYASQIKLGTKVKLQQGEKSYEGVIDFIASSIDTKTDTLLLRAKFANESQELLIGSYVQIVVDGFSYKNAAIIPEYALIKTPEAVVVYVIEENGSLRMQKIEIAHTQEGKATVVSGLNAGDKIVVSNIAKLRPNSKVSIIGGE